MEPRKDLTKGLISIIVPVYNKEQYVEDIILQDLNRDCREMLIFS